MDSHGACSWPDNTLNITVISCTGNDNIAQDSHANACGDLQITLQADGDEGQAACDTLGIEVLPTVQFWKSKQMLWEHRGVTQLDQDLSEGASWSRMVQFTSHCMIHSRLTDRSLQRAQHLLGFCGRIAPRRLLVFACVVIVRFPGMCICCAQKAVMHNCTCNDTRVLVMPCCHVTVTDIYQT